MTPRGVIFDCDGVLVDSEPMTFDLLQVNLAAHGLALEREEIERRFIGGTMPGLYTKARALGADLPPTWVEDFYVLLYDRLAQGTPLVPGIAALLDRLAARGIPVAIGSNGSDAKMRITLGQHPAVRAHFGERVFSGQALGCPKPDPGLYLHAAGALGVPPGQCAVVEDSPTGARAAARACIPCFGYAPTGDGALLAAEGATLFRRMEDLPELFGL